MSDNFHIEFDFNPTIGKVKVFITNLSSGETEYGYGYNSNLSKAKVEAIEDAKIKFSPLYKENNRIKFDKTKNYYTVDDAEQLRIAEREAQRRKVNQDRRTQIYAQNDDFDSFVKDLLGHNSLSSPQPQRRVIPNPVTPQRQTYQPQPIRTTPTKKVSVYQNYAGSIKVVAFMLYGCGFVVSLASWSALLNFIFFGSIALGVALLIAESLPRE